VLWPTATVEFVARLKKLWKLVATKLLTGTATAAQTVVQTVPVVPFTLPLQQLSLQLQLLQQSKLFQHRLLQPNLRPSSLLAFTRRRQARAVWLVCSE